MMTQGHLKTRFCMQKLLEIGRLLFSNFSVCFNFFATYYNLPLLLIFAWNFDLLGDLVIISVRKISFADKFCLKPLICPCSIILCVPTFCNYLSQVTQKFNFVCKKCRRLLFKFAGCSSIINFVCSSFLQFNID